MLTENDFDGYIPAHNTVGARRAHNMRTEANYRQRGIENQAIVISPKTTHPPTTNWAGFVF
jgi:hypothetical protein